MASEQTRLGHSPPRPAVILLKQFTRQLLRWGGHLQVLIVVLFGCGQLALWNPFPQALANPRGIAR